MGRKKKDLGIGRSIIRDRFQGKREAKSGDSFLHTSELNDGADWGRLNLQSVTEQSNLEDFLATAELAGTEFTAERLNIQIVGTEHYSGLPSAEELKQTQVVQDENKALLTVPRRPFWDEHTTTEELDLNERTSFLEWRRRLAQLQENEKLVMTPFERNLDFWRQLWRVIERSDLVLQIVDARNPLLFRCEDLEKYVKEVNENKGNMILINKADLLTEGQREYWAQHFDTVGMRVAFWSAVLETERCKQLQMEEDAKDEDDVDDDEDEDEDEESTDESIEEKQDTESLDEHPQTSETENVKDLESEKIKSSEKSQTSKDLSSDDHSEETMELGEAGSSQSECTRQQSINAMTEQFQNVTSEASPIDCGKSTAAGSCRDCGEESVKGASSSDPGSSSIRNIDQGATGYKNNPALLTGDELIDLLKNTHNGPKVTEGLTTIGMVGYPNVGKSSSINAILQSKKVPVSATPGRTKHFQTLYVDPTVLLCDCPGLVMPTFVTTKAEMVVSGILPIDQMRDHIPPTSLVCRYIPREVLEATYGIMLPQPGEGEDPTRPPTAHELLTAYGYMRGYMTHKGVPDFPRSSRNILKDFMNGKLLYAHPPPGVAVEDFQSAAPAQKEQKLFKADPTGQQRKGHSMYTSSVDRQFFEQVNVGMGVKGTAGKIAADGGLATSRAKPDKKHFKKGKKEKLRRLHGHLDV